MQSKSASKSIGANIRKMRLEKGLSQDDLAAALYVTRQTVSNYETGRSQPGLDMLQQISVALDVELMWLLYGKPESPRRQGKRTTLILTAVSCGLLILTWFLYGYTASLFHRTYFTLPHILVRLTLVPLSMTLLGTTLLQWIDFCFGIGKWRSPKIQEAGKAVIIGFLSLNVLAAFPYLIWCLSIFFQTLSGNTSITAIFPQIPIYQGIAYFFLTLMYAYPFVYAGVGVAVRLFFPPQ